MKNKKIILRSFAVLLSMAMLIWGVPVVSATEQEAAFEYSVSERTKVKKASETLMQYFYAKGDGIIYPDYYGGCYIEDDLLHIRLAEPTAEELSALKNILSSYLDVVEFEYGEYSKAYAEEYADKVADELKEAGITVTYWGVRDNTCSVVIGIIHEDSEAADEKVKEIELRSANKNEPKIVIEPWGYVMELWSEIGESSEEKKELFEKLVAAQERAVKASDALTAYFYYYAGKDSNVRGDGITYPDYFSGCYIEENILHICLADPTKEELSTLKNLLSGYLDVIVFEYRNCSAEYAQNYVDNVAHELIDQGIEVTSWHVDQKTGNVVVGVLHEHYQVAKEKVEEIEFFSLSGYDPDIVLIKLGYVTLQ